MVAAMRSGSQTSSQFDLTVSEEQAAPVIQEADWRQGPLLRFRDFRLERRYCSECFGQKRYWACRMGCFWAVFGFVELAIAVLQSTMLDSPQYFDAAAATMIVSRFVFNSILLLLCGLVHFNCMDLELAACVVVYMMPVAAWTNNKYRMSTLFQSSLYERDIVACTAQSCTDDSMGILSVLISMCVPLLLNVRVTKALPVVPFSTMMYALFSFWGPLPTSDAVLNTLLLLCNGCFILVGIYRIERELRHAFAEAGRLRLQTELQKQELETHRRMLREVEDRLEAFDETATVQLPVKLSSSLQSGFEASGCEHAHSNDRDFTVPAPCQGLRFPSLRNLPRLPLLMLDGVDTPNETLSRAMAGRTLDTERLKRMAQRLGSPSYGLRDFFQDAVATFPELDLFFVDGANVTSSGNDGPMEYQRTIGALFALYWLVRSDGDGRLGFAFGCDSKWQVRLGPDRSDEKLNRRKRHLFFRDTPWPYFEEVTNEALGGSFERMEAMLCLTAFHDIMKMPLLCPRVSEKHGPYEGYQVGDVINDHDRALAYVLEFYPDLLPSFRALPEESRALILFTQGKLQFNHGWFVQAEAPPGIMLTKFKQEISRASSKDLAFYFLHWLTDLSGAEGRPLAGAEKFVLKFPRSVLSSFIWSIPFLLRLAGDDEVPVVERYLEARYEQLALGTPMPCGPSAIALLRLSVMAQSKAELVFDAFSRLPPCSREVLATELARSGIDGQLFQRSPKAGGPALFVYYGPALLQCCTTASEMTIGLQTLASVYHAARFLWPLRADDSSTSVLLEAGCFKANSVHLVSMRPNDGPRAMLLERRSGCEGVVARLTVERLNELISAGTPFRALDLNSATCINGFADEMTQAADLYASAVTSQV